jgi:regulator of sigma E protease
MIILYVIIGLSLLILVHELGHFFAAKLFGVRVDKFGFGYPPRLFSKKYGETEYSINALPFGGFVKIYGENEATVDKSDPDYKRSFAFQPAWKRSVILLAGIFMNVVFGWLLLSFVFAIGAPEYVGIVSVADSSPAENAGLQAGDIILETQRGEEILDNLTTTDRFINFVKETPEGLFTLTIQRDGKTFETDISGRINPPPGEGSLGVALVNMGIEKKPLFTAFWHGLKTSIQMLGAIAVGFYTIITKAFTTPEIMENIAGPVGIFVITKQVSTIGFIYLVQFIGFISLNLVILNLIPFPALDGGRFFFILIEKIKGSPVSGKVQMVINAAGFLLLIALMIFVTVKDIGRFIL